MIVVIGGGPAGAAAARFLAMWGHDVQLVTRTPPKHSLAESLPPSCIKLFDQLGVREEIDNAGFIRATGNTVQWGAGEQRVESFGGGALGYQILRAPFDALLLDAAERAGARVIRDATVTALGREHNRWTVACENNGSSHTIDAEWLLDCSGRTGVVARDGWRRAREGARTMALIGEWESASAWELPDHTHTFVETYEGGWAWSVPVSATRRFFTVMVDPRVTNIAAKNELQTMYRAELSRTHRIAGLLARATLVEDPWARDASPYTSDRFGERGTMLVGDAASFIDPLSSYGVKKALASAWLASVVVRSSLRDATLVEPGLALFESRERAMFDAMHNQTMALARDAASSHASDFWRDRTQFDELPVEGEPDVAALRIDQRVLAAFDELKRRDSVRFQAGPVQQVNKATIRANEIVLLPHLVHRSFPSGVRYLRGIDLVVLSDLAVRHSQVPDLFDAYNRHAPPAPLPDFLGALSVLLGTGMLAFA